MKKTDLDYKSPFPDLQMDPRKPPTIWSHSRTLHSEYTNHARLSKAAEDVRSLDQAEGAEQY